MPSHIGHIDPNARPTSVTNGNPKTGAYLHYQNNITGYGGSSNFGWVVNHDNEAYPATESRGGGAAHSHGDTGLTTPGHTGSSSSLPPYRVVYAWERTA